MKRLLRRLLKLSTFRISMIISLLFFALFLLKEERAWDFGFFDLMELKALDVKFQARGVNPPNGQVAIAAIDEKSMESFGRWPWNRLVIARLIAVLHEAGASVVAFDANFTDPDTSNFKNVVTAVAQAVDELDIGDEPCRPAQTKIADYLKQQAAEADPDLILSETIREASNVVLGYWIYRNREDIAFRSRERLEKDLECILPSKISIIKSWNPEDPNAYGFSLAKGAAVQAPLPVLCDPGSSYGSFSFSQDLDGAVRWADMVQEIDSGDPDLRLFFPSLSLMAAAKHLNAEMVLHTYPMGIDQISLGLGEDVPQIRTNFLGKLLINYHGPGGTYPTYSIADILGGETPPGAFNGKIVLVGATATGLFDLRVTPFQENFPGVEIHANIIDNILNNDYIQRPDWAYYFELGIILFFGVLFGAVLGRLRALWGALFIVFILLSYYYIDKYFFFSNGYWVKIVMPLLLAFALFFICYIYRFFTEEKDKRRTRSAFKQYLNESVVDLVMQDFDKLQLGGEKREITVLFSDIRDFTTVSETLSPDELGAILTEYLNPMTQLVFDEHGVLDKYMGDAIMAFWGAPSSQPDHAARACRTALAMTRRLEQLNLRWHSRGVPRMEIGIGLNTGPMWVGNMGSQVRFDYTIIGDSVNLGSRLESTNKQYGTHIIISEFTYQTVKDNFCCRELDSIRVKGKNLPVTIYELLEEGTGDEQAQTICRLFAIGLAHYRNQRFEDALNAFHDVLLEAPNDAPSRVFSARCKQFIKQPPPLDWDGVYIMTSK
jgi:adenylate cyclase